LKLISKAGGRFVGQPERGQKGCSYNAVFWHMQLGRRRSSERHNISPIDPGSLADVGVFSSIFSLSVSFLAKVREDAKATAKDSVYSICRLFWNYER